MKLRVLLLSILLLIAYPLGAQSDIIITPIAHNLNNPRGIAVTPNGSLLVVEAGLGTDEGGQYRGKGSGTIKLMQDNNGDGDLDDEGERIDFISNASSYNSLALLRTGHDEVFGLSDIVRLEDGRIFFNLDDPYFEAPRNRGEEVYYGNTGIFEGTGGARIDEPYLKRIATLNGLVFDETRQTLYATESGFNRVMANQLDTDEVTIVAEFNLLANGEQPVPSGITLDPITGDLLVSLFGGYIYEYYDDSLSFVPGNAKIVRANPETGIVEDEITGLTTAIDVAVDEFGNIYTVELTRQWATPFVPFDFDLSDTTLLPEPGGYARDTGRISMYPADGSDPIILADNIDTPTNITYHDSALYVSTGLGTPNRNVWTPDGIRPIEGIIYKIEGFLESTKD